MVALPLSPGLAEKTQLLKLSVPATFMLVALDEGPGPPIKYQYAELTKLYAVVSQLLRCCDVSTRMQSSINGMFHSLSPPCGCCLFCCPFFLSCSLSLCFIRSLMVPISLSGSLSVILSRSCFFTLICILRIKRRVQIDINVSHCPLGNPALANPYGDANLTTPIMPLQQLVSEILFVRTSYVKKIIEDCSNSEETVKLLRFSCWENPQFSSTVLSELLWQVRG